MQILIDIGLLFVYITLLSLLFIWFVRFWMMYRNQEYNNSLKWTMLEIKLPAEINKSPYATELAISSLLQNGGVSTKYDTKILGKQAVFSSLEIASIEGVVHFYVRIQSRFKNLVEASFYAQYPGIEIVEADDYTKLIRYHHLSNDVSMFGAMYKPSAKWIPTNPKTGKPYKKGGSESDVPGEKDDKVSLPADFLPFKTYVDYGLDKDPKEEYKIDPIVPILEAMGTLGKGEHMWYQILFSDESVYNDKKMPKLYVNPVTHKHLNLKEMADSRKEQIRTASWNIKGSVKADEFGVPSVVDAYKKNEDGSYEQLFDIETDKDGKQIKKPKKKFAQFLETKPVFKPEMSLTQDEKDELEAINRKFSKHLALTNIRLVYIAKRENFKGSNVPPLIVFPRNFKGVNSFGLGTSDPYDYPWQKRFHGVEWRTEEMFEAYVEREAFFPHIGGRKVLDQWEDRFFWSSPMKHRKIFRMIYEGIFHPFGHPQPEWVFTANLEEIATLWHLPGATAATPTLPRINSTKGVAPVNLPL